MELVTVTSSIYRLGFDTCRLALAFGFGSWFCPALFIQFRDHARQPCRRGRQGRIVRPAGDGEFLGRELVCFRPLCLKPCGECISVDDLLFADPHFY